MYRDDSPKLYRRSLDPFYDDPFYDDENGFVT